MDHDVARGADRCGPTTWTVVVVLSHICQASQYSVEPFPALKNINNVVIRNFEAFIIWLGNIAGVSQRASVDSRSVT